MVHSHIIQSMKGLYSSISMEWWDRYVLNFVSRIRAEHENVDNPKFICKHCSHINFGSNLLLCSFKSILKGNFSSNISGNGSELEFKIMENLI